jgi:bifunctional non-homologous end joining protein LigD
MNPQSADPHPERDIVLEGRALSLARLEKVLWPGDGFTKGDLIDYYRSVAAVILPHLEGRPVTLARFPDGMDGPAWYQSNCRGHPPWMRTREVRARTGETLEYCVINDLPSLVWAANQATIELHPFLWTESSPEQPTAVVFDLDPGAPATITACCRVALRIRALLEEEGLESFPKTSGAHGLHVYVPISVSHGFEDTKPFARRVAAALAEELPDQVVDRPSKSLRRGRVLVDWGQNDVNRSTIAVYSLRAAASPAVSTPLRWEEVEAGSEGDPGRLRFGPGEVLDRVDALGDVFWPVMQLRQPLSQD